MYGGGDSDSSCEVKLIVFFFAVFSRSAIKYLILQPAPAYEE